MIQQTRIGLASRELANPYNKDGFLPLITAPMYSVVDETNYQIFLDNKIRVCLPRNKEYIGCNKDGTFISLSLDDFKSRYITPYQNVDFFGGFQCTEFVCVDCANGNIPQLHEALRKAKEIHGDNLVIMVGNVSSVEAFIELAKTGVDYIRVGIGGGAGCNTTSNTGVGQEDLENLIYVIKRETERFYNYLKDESEIQPARYGFYDVNHFIFYETLNHQEILNIINVKIVADGISSYIKQCESKYGFNGNGYAAINKLLFTGADLVMIGGLFAQCVESAGEKGVQGFNKVHSYGEWNENRTKSGLFGMPAFDTPKDYFAVSGNGLLVKYSGMSTQEEQKKYRNASCYNFAVFKGNGVLAAYYETKEEAIESCEKDKDYTWKDLTNIRPSEGSVKWIPVRWTLKEWLLGSENQDQYPYLMGWVNSIKSAMAYTNKTTL